LPDSGLDLGSQPTMSRWENAPNLREVIRLMGVMIDLYCASYATPPVAVTLDIDDTLDVVHGHQQLSLFNAHYDERAPRGQFSSVEYEMPAKTLDSISYGSGIRFASWSSGCAKAPDRPYPTSTPRLRLNRRRRFPRYRVRRGRDAREQRLRRDQISFPKTRDAGDLQQKFCESGQPKTEE
jgi:hypothetical protein